VSIPLLIIAGCAPKPSVIRRDRRVTDFIQEYNGAVGASSGAAKHWLGSGQGWGIGPRFAVAAERAYPVGLAWWASLAWRSHDLWDATRAFEDGSGQPLTATDLDGQQVLIWGGMGIQYTPDRGWGPPDFKLRILTRSTLAVDRVQTRMDIPASEGRARLATTALLIAPNRHRGLQAVWIARRDFRRLFGVAPTLAFDRAELGGGDRSRLSLRTHAAPETLVRF
jgi:hypothetical protein